MLLRNGLVVVLLASFLVSCKPSEADVVAAINATATAAAAEACSPAKLTAFADAVEAKIGDFEQQARLVGSTSRVGLGVPLQRLLDIQTETRKIDTPPCAKSFLSDVTSAMEAYQQGYQNFSAQGEEIMTTAFLTSGQTILAYTKKGLPTLRDGKVPEPFKADLSALTATPK